MRYQRVRVGEGGEIVLPAERREELGINVGDNVTLTVRDGVLSVMTAAAAIANARRILGVSPWQPGDPSWADELIAERRAEAARE